MRVLIPTALRSYTGGKDAVQAQAPTAAALIRELDRRFPGFAFRIVDEQGGLRPHIRLSVNAEVIAGLDAALGPGDEVAIIMAFSGG